MTGPLHVLALDEAAGRQAVDEARAGGWAVHAGFHPPSGGWSIEGRRIVCHGEGRTREDADAALLAGVRGAGLVVVADPGWALLPALFDDLRRLGPVEVRAGSPGQPPLTAEQHAMLALVAAGASLPQVARELHWSLRTVNRRLAEARAVLGARTTAQALARLDRRTSAPRPARLARIGEAREPGRP
jgi:DNA-binding CsgD family transcriptional regulator